MSGKKLRKVLAAVSAVAMLAGSVSAPLMSVSAGQVLGETDFTYKSLPWHTCESSPAMQDFEVKNGAFHVSIIRAEGADSEKWDLQLRYRNLNFKAGHEYKVSFKAKAKRAGMELSTHIGNIKGDKEYFTINEDKMQMGPHMGGEWGKAAELTTEWKEYSGIFTPDENIEGAEWAFHYAKGTQYEGNAKDGDEIWFDDMSIFCDTCDECDACPDTSYGAVSRDWGAKKVNPDTYMPDGKLNNYISVNQIGYYPGSSKVAVLGDNKGDFFHNSSAIDLTKDTYDFNVCDAASGDIVYSGKSGQKTVDKDSNDTVCKLDFTEFKTPGRYYIKVGDWRSFEFSIDNDIYSAEGHNMLTNSLNYFYQNRSGMEIKEEYITSGDKKTLAHCDSNMKDTASVQKIWKNEYSSMAEATSTYASSQITANGGWHDAENYCKSVVDDGISVWTLQNMYERAINKEIGKKKFADGSGTVVIPETGNKIPDILDEAAYELDWMTSMVVKPDEPTWGKYEGLVYHKLQDYKWTGLATSPYTYDRKPDTGRIVKPPTFAATLNYAACAAQASRLWKPYDEKKADFYLEEAKKAYAAYEKYWYEPSADEDSNKESLYEPLYQSIGSWANIEAEVKDEAYWAACEIFVSAKEMNDPAADDYYAKLAEYKNAFNVMSRITGYNSCEGTLTTFDSDNTACAGSLTLALHQNLLSEKDCKTLKESILEAANEFVSIKDEQGYGIPYLYDGPGYNHSGVTIMGYESDSNFRALNNAIVMAYAYDQTKNNKYINGVTTAMDYLLGTNPLSFSYITGYGTYHEQNPYHKYWANELDPTLPKAPDGVLSSGPNAGLQDKYVRGLGLVGGLDNPSQRCFVDSVESWSTNQASIYGNSQLAWITSFLQDEYYVEKIPPVPVETTTETTVTEKSASQTTETDKPVTTTKVTDKTETDKPVTTTKVTDKTETDKPVTTTKVTDKTETDKPVTTTKVTDKTETDKPVTTTKVTDKTETDKPVTTTRVTEKSVSEMPDKDLMYGDIDGNRKVEITDLSCLSLYLLDDYTLTGSALKAADVNGDGKVNLADLAHLKQFICKDPVTLGPKK